MTKTALILLALSVFTVQGAVVRHADTPLKREIRCDQCEQNHRPPLPPGRGYHTQNWSGYSRNAGGEGVFSGAAAATQGGGQSAGQAFSIAASEAVAGTAGNGGQKQNVASGASAGYGGGAGGYGSSAGGSGGKSNYGSNYKESHSHKNGGSDQFEGRGDIQGGYDGNLQQSQSNGFNSATQAQSNANSATGYEGGAGRFDDKSGQSSYRESRGKSPGDSDNQQQTQSNGFHSASHTQSNANSGDSDRHVAQFGKYSSGSEAQSGSGQYKGEDKFHHAGAFGHDTQQVQSGQGGSGHSAGKNGGAGAGEEAGSVGTGLEYGGQETVQSTLGGALNLASQSLQTAQQTGCSTCGKSSYALSNAKSNSGSAVAVSIGG